MAAAREFIKAQQRHPFVVTLRKKLLGDGVLVKMGGFFVFSKDAEFSSPSAPRLSCVEAARMDSRNGRARMARLSRNSMRWPDNNIHRTGLCAAADAER